MSAFLTDISYDIDEQRDRAGAITGIHVRSCAFMLALNTRGGRVSITVPLTHEERAELAEFARRVYRRHRAEEYDRLREEMMGEAKG